MTPSSMFDAVGIPYGSSLPLFVLAIFVILAIPALFTSGSKAHAVALATYCCLAQMLGVILMTGSALPALYAVFARQPLSEPAYLGLLMVFGIGGLMFLLHDARLQTIDAASRSVPVALFTMTWKFIGLLTIVIAGISFLMRLMLIADRFDHWWIVHLVMLLYGLILTWFTLDRSTPAPRHAVPAKRILIAHKRKK